MSPAKGAKPPGGSSVASRMKSSSKSVSDVPRKRLMSKSEWSDSGQRWRKLKTKAGQSVYQKNLRYVDNLIHWLGDRVRSTGMRPTSWL